MKWFNRQPKKGSGLERVVLLLIQRTRDIVKETSRDLEKHLGNQDRSKLPNIQSELFYFFLFSLDYWWQTNSAHTQQENRSWGEIFDTHVRNLCGGDPTGLAMWNTFQQRKISYGQIVNQAKGDNAAFFGFGRQLSESCGMPGNPFFLVLAPDLFTKALEALTSLRL